MRATLERLRPYLELSDERIEALMGTARRYFRQPLLVDSDADFDAVAALEERRAFLPGVFIEMRPKRHYPAGPATAHVLGYVGEITSEELERETYAEYEARMIVGKEGIERQYEAGLQGSRGLRFVEVDAVGRIVGAFRGDLETPADPGGDITLNLDLGMMEWIHRIFPDSMKGAVVALDVEDGGVLALYSSPTFDPNSFVGGIEPEEWRRLNTDPAQPLYTRPVLGLYPPASTFKLVSAAIGLELGLITPDERMPQPCTGAFRFGNRVSRCWDRSGHGSLDLTGALANSCDVYFYQLGLRIGLQRLLDEAGRLGFRGTCEIDHPNESNGIFPADDSFWERRWGYKPTEGEVLSLAIGQGANSQTPLRIAQLYAAIARGGDAPAPRLLRQADAPVSWELELTPESLDALMDGLAAVMAPGGTGYLSTLEHFQTWGKSGTGENPLGLDHALFALLAGRPGARPEIAVVAVVEHGESGSRVAAPIAAKAADFYLRRKYDIPVDSIQTLRDHYRVGRPAPWAVR
jgi:penicillin-binding protein 2